MSATVSGVVAERVRTTHGQLLQVTESLDAAQLAWSPGRLAPPVQFHLFHVARHADRLQALLSRATPALAERLGPADELWAADRLAAAWGIDEAALGPALSGMGMDHDAAAVLALPSPPLRDYARRVFAATDRAVAAIDDEQFGAAGDDYDRAPTTVGTLVVNHLAHACRHLGMIEGLLGVQGQVGTATI